MNIKVMNSIGKHSIRKISLLVLAIVSIIALSACSAQSDDNDNSDHKIRVVATTTMLADMVNAMGGEYVTVDGLMGPGIDPHLYKASAGDVELMQNADLIVYSGLHLEGKMGEIFENLKSMDKHIVKISEGLPESELIIDEATGAHDPHIWFNVQLWKEASNNLKEGLITLDPEHEMDYTANYEAYVKTLDDLDTYVREQIETIPESSRVLVTAHDAFQYFGKAYGVDVRGLQGISTSSEAGTADVKDLADFIVQNKIKAIFVESSVPKKNIEALQEAVKAQGFEVEIGGELYSDSLGSPGSDAETYVGTVKSNVDTIVGALK